MFPSSSKMPWLRRSYAIGDMIAGFSCNLDKTHTVRTIAESFGKQR